MARKIETRFEQAATEGGHAVLDLAGDEFHAFVKLVTDRCGVDELHALWGIRDAAQMSSAKILDSKDEAIAAETRDLKAKLAK